MRNNIWLQLGFGAAAGLARTMAIQALLKAHEKISPETLPPISEHPGKFMLRKAKEALPEKAQHVVEKIESAGGNLLGLGYGVTFGVIYAAIRPKTRRTLLEGALLGLGTWAAAYLGWLPGAKLMPPVWKQKPLQVALPAVEHTLFGVATVAGYRWLRQRINA